MEEAKTSRKKNILLSPFTLYAKSTKDPDKVLRMSFGVSGTGFPFINVDPDENIEEKTPQNNFGKLTARIGGYTFYALMNLLKVAKNKEPGWKMGLQNYHTYVDGKHLEVPQHVNDVLVGVDTEGCVWISIVENGRSSVRFFFGPTDWHNWKNSNGENATKKEMNHYAVDGFVTGLSYAIAAVMGFSAGVGNNLDEKHPENKEAEQAGGGKSPYSKPYNSNNNWKGNNQNKYSNNKWQGNNNWKNKNSNWKGGNNNWQNRNNQNNNGYRKADNWEPKKDVDWGNNSNSSTEVEFDDVGY